MSNHHFQGLHQLSREQLIAQLEAELEGMARTRIKQKFSATGPLDLPWYPPKWSINSKIETEFSSSASPMRNEKDANKSTAQSTLDLGSS